MLRRQRGDPASSRSKRSSRSSSSAAATCATAHARRSLAKVGFLVTVVDAREAWGQEGRHRGGHLPRRRLRRRGAPRCRPHGAVLVMTHDHQIDQAAIEWALGRGFAYVGGVGSRAKAQRTSRPARAQGRSARRTCARGARMPIGVDIGARLPDEIAVSITSRNGRLAPRDPRASPQPRPFPRRAGEGSQRATARRSWRLSGTFGWHSPLLPRGSRRGGLPAGTAYVLGSARGAPGTRSPLRSSSAPARGRGSEGARRGSSCSGSRSPFFTRAAPARRAATRCSG